MLLGSLFCSAFFVVALMLAVAGSARPHRGTIACGVAAAGIVGGVLLSSGTCMLNGLLVFLAALVASSKYGSLSSYRNAILGGTALCYAIMSGCVVYNLRDIPRLRERYPLESMAERLAYESHGRSNRPSQMLDDQTDARLKELESRIGLDNTGAFFLVPGGKLPERSLEDLHRGYVHHFVNSPGFGLGRMVRSDYRWLRRRVYNESTEEAPLTLPPPSYEDPIREKAYGDPWPEGRATTSTASSRDSLLKFHLGGLLDFVNHGHFGYIGNRDQVAGFLPHRFHTMPTFEQASAWKLDTLELVSLFKHAEPVAYVSHELPRMDKLREVPVRPLTEHERTMLDGLRRGEDLQVRSISDRIRMLGAIRAAEQCLQCHEVDRGTLLGAFSYKLRLEQ